MSGADGTALRARVAEIDREIVLVWVDSREARIVREGEPEPTIERLVSDVPAHRSSIRHIRHDPAVRHGGGAAQDAADHRRIAHLDAFIGAVAARVDAEADVVVVGPGTAHERLARRLEDEDAVHRRSRRVSTDSSDHPTDRQLKATLRHRVRDRESAARGDSGQRPLLAH